MDTVAAATFIFILGAFFGISVYSKWLEYRSIRAVRRQVFHPRRGSINRSH